MKKALVNAAASKASPAGGRVRLAKVVEAKRSSRKGARQAAFNELASHLPVAEAASRAKLISEMNPAKFHIVRMPG
jgi:hypothetical protein